MHDLPASFILSAVWQALYISEGARDMQSREGLTIREAGLVANAGVLDDVLLEALVLLGNVLQVNKN